MQSDGAILYTVSSVRVLHGPGTLVESRLWTPSERSKSAAVTASAEWKWILRPDVRPQSPNLQ